MLIPFCQKDHKQTIKEHMIDRDQDLHRRQC